MGHGRGCALSQTRGGTSRFVAGRRTNLRNDDRASTPCGYPPSVDRVCRRHPVGAGVVASLARPGGNVTGFSQREYGLGAKSLELLKEVAPRLAYVAVVRDATTTGGAAQFAAIQTAAAAFGIEATTIDAHDNAEIERNIIAFADRGNSGLIVATGAQVQVHRALIITLAARYRLPAIYPSRFDLRARVERRRGIA